MRLSVTAARSSKRLHRNNQSNIPDTYDGREFNRDQMRLIREGKEAGLNVGMYADPKFDAGQMAEIRKGLKSGVDVSMYADPKFDYYQMRVIRDGLEAGVDVRIYAYPKFDCHQMREIERGLEAGVDASMYAYPAFDHMQMYEIRLGLEAGVDVRVYADPSLSWDDMQQIKINLEKGLPYDYGKLSKNDKAKARWNVMKNEIARGTDKSINEIEEEFDLVYAEASAARKLGLEFDENADGSVTFYDENDNAVATLSKEEYDDIVLDAIRNSSTKASFTKAFATRLRRVIR